MHCDSALILGDELEEAGKRRLRHSESDGYYVDITLRVMHSAFQRSGHKRWDDPAKSVVESEQK